MHRMINFRTATCLIGVLLILAPYARTTVAQTVKRSQTAPAISAAPINSTAALQMPAAKDSQLRQDLPMVNFGYQSTLNVETDSNAIATARPVMQFTLPPLPPQTTVISASLHLYAEEKNNNPVNVHRISAPWTETEVTWANAASMVDGTSTASFIPANPGPIEVDVSDLVRSWVDQSHPNYGLLLAANLSDQLSRFTSRESNKTDRHPYLTITVAVETLALEADQDGWINSVSANLNYGACDLLTLDASDDSLGQGRPLVRFDLAAIPADSALISAYLQLTKSGGATASHQIQAHQVTSAWVEGEGGCAGAAGAVNWNERQSGVNWSAAGGDFSSAPLDTVTVQANAPYLWDVTAAALQWYAGSGPNYGLLLGTPDRGIDLYFFAGRTAAGIADRPQLILSYIPGQPGIGDRVWHDVNRDSVQDLGEPGLAGVTVKLYTGSCAAPSTDTLLVDVTNSNGQYFFRLTNAGTYCVAVDESTLPLDYAASGALSPRDVTFVAESVILDADFGYSSARALDRVTIGHYAPCPNVSWLDSLASGAGLLAEGADFEACLFTYTGAETGIANFLAAVEADARTRHSHHDVWTVGSYVPNDPDYANPTLVYAPQQINAPAAWDLTTGSSDVIVAVLDTGVDLTHPEFAGRLLPGYDFANDDADPTDDHGHGTHVAGIIGAAINNGMGVAGMAGTVKILPVKVLNSQNSGWISDVAQGMTWAVDQGARVINLSLGGTVPSQALADAIAYAVSRGATVVAAAGNNNSNTPFYPASYETVVAVGATDYSESRWSLSNYGPNVDVMAPGAFIWNTYWSAATGSGYQFMTGTSMAAPHVAGAAALLYSRNPNLTFADIKSLLQSTAQDLGGPGVDSFYGYGEIDAGAATAAVAVQPKIPPVASLTGQIWVDVNASGWVDPGDTLRYTTVAANGDVAPQSNVVVSSSLPLYTTYVPGSVTLSGIPVLDDSSGATLFPLDAGGINIGAIPAGGNSRIAFDVMVNQPPRGVYTLVARAQVVSALATDTLLVETPVAGTLVHLQTDPPVARPGETLTYTLTTDYLGQDLLGNVVVSAAVPAGTTYAPGSANAGGFEAGGADGLKTVNWNLGSSAYPVSASASAASTSTLSVNSRTVQTVTTKISSRSAAQVGPVLATANAPVSVTLDLRAAVTRTLQLRIYASGDDAEEVGPGGPFLGGEGNVYVNSSDLEMVTDNDNDPSETSGVQTVGLRFRAAPIPPGALVTRATITFRAIPADTPNTNNDTTNLTIQGQAADNPTGFTATNNNPSFDISSRPRTTAAVAWQPPAETASTTPWIAGSDHATPDLAAIVQELVNRPNWTQGNSMVFILQGTGSRSAASFDGDGDHAPLLTVEFVDRAAVIGPLPTLIITGTNGVTATLLSGPMADPLAGEPSGTRFTWLYQTQVADQMGQLTFGGAATTASVTWPWAQSNSVIVHPPLTFQTTVNSPAGVNAVQNTAFISDAEGLLPSRFSNLAQTGLLSSIGDFVWDDRDGDAIQDSGEPGIDGVTLILTDSAGGMRTTQSGSAGAYQFSDLVTGVYTLTLEPATLPVHYEFHTTPEVLTVVLASGQTFQAGDFGFKARSINVGDVIWYDTNGDGLQSLGESGIGNVTLDLYYDSNLDGQYTPLFDYLVDSTVSNAAGMYNLAASVAGTYFIDVTDDNGILADLAHTVGPQSITDPSPALILNSGAIYVDGDFGYLRMPGSGAGVVGDLVWVDVDGNGVRALAEPVVIGLQVCATPLGGGAATCTQTDHNGRYLLELPAGGYSVAPTTSPAGLTATTPVPRTVSVAAGGQHMGLDFGYQGDGSQLGIIGGLIWQDLPLNEAYDGIYDELSEPGIPNVSVDVVLDLNEDGVWDGREPYLATISSLSGLYQFDGLLPGAYLVQVSDSLRVLRNFAPTVPALTGASHNTNQSQPHQVALAPGAVDESGDFGYREYEVAGLAAPVEPGLIGDLVWDDADGNGIYNPAAGDLPLPGVTLRLNKEGAPYAQTTTGIDGKYLFSDLAPGNYSVQVTDLFGVLTGYTPVIGPIAGQSGYSQEQPYPIALSFFPTNLSADFGLTTLAKIGGGVYEDLDGDAVLDEGEPGVAGISVQLNTGAVDVTDATGRYTFTVPANATYTIILSDPGKYVLGRGQKRAARAASAGDLTVTVGASEQKLANNFLTYQPALLSGLVWNDIDANGSQNGSEPVLDGAVVHLRGAGLDGLFGTGDDEEWGQQLTVAGIYTFTGLPPGRYQVVLDPISLPLGLSSLVGDSQTVTLTSGATGIQASYPLDYGGKAVLGNYVWQDLDGDGDFVGDPLEGEFQGMDGITLTLWLDWGAVGFDPAEDLLLDRTVTGDNPATPAVEQGWYAFAVAADATLPDSPDFWVVVENANFVSTGALAGFAQTNGGVFPDHQRYYPKLSSAGATDADFGYWVAGDYTLEKQLITPDPVRVGVEVTFTLRITNNGPSWLAVLPLTDTYDLDYLRFVRATPPPADLANDGTLNWPDLTPGVDDLAPGAERVVWVIFQSLKDTTPEPTSASVNRAGVSGAWLDPDGPSGPMGVIGQAAAQTTAAPIRILNPTGVLAVGMAAQVQNGQAHLTWRTLDESTVVGFSLWRQSAADPDQRLTPTLLPARFGGSPTGAAYDFVDQALQPGRIYHYRLAIHLVDGRTEELSLGSLGARWRLFAPITFGPN